MYTNSRFAPLIYLLVTIIAQLIGASFASGMAQFNVPLPFMFIIHSLISGYLAFFFRLSKPWIFLNFMVPAGILISMAFPGYGWVWLSLFVVYALLYIPTFWTRVPYYPSSKLVYDLIAEQLPANKPFKFLDIGCGNAKLLSYLADKYPQAKFEGIDLSPSAIIAAKFICAGKSNVQISLGNYWKKSFSEYDFIYAFLSPTPMPEIQKKAQQEMKTGSIMIANSFALPDLQPSLSFNINEKNQKQLLIYKF